MAATWLAEVLTYSTPPTISGVASFHQVRICGSRAISSSSGDVQRHATRSRLTLSRGIWSGDEERAFALVPPWVGHSPRGGTGEAITAVRVQLARPTRTGAASKRHANG